MMKRLLICFLISATILLPSNRAEAQLRKSVATIIFAGLGGAILGLSTLSFYGNPQDHLGNISTGFALGIVAGTVFVTIDSTQQMAELKPWNVPTNPSQMKTRAYSVSLLNYAF